jgi:probable HAF family extracellular repeat protein
MSEETFTHRSHIMNKLSSSMMIVIVLLATINQGKGASYTITDLGSFGGITGANSINNHGQVTGYSYLDSSSTSSICHAFFYSSGTLTDLGTDGSYAWDINDDGQVVGSIGDKAFLYENKQISLLGGISSNASAINDKGQIVGWSYNTTAMNTHAVLFHDGTFTDLGTLDGLDSYARDINSHGQIVGSSSKNAYLHAFLYDDEKMIDLGTLGGSCQAFALNNLGDVVGYSDTNEGTHGFLYRNSAMTDLGTLGGAFSNANDINDDGHIVGCSETANNRTHAFLISTKIMIDLNNLIASDSGWELMSAEGINNCGQIVGYGIHNGNPRAFLLTPIPEPSSFTLGITCVIGFLFLTWFQRQRNQHF